MCSSAGRAELALQPVPAQHQQLWRARNNRSRGSLHEDRPPGPPGQAPLQQHWQQGKRRLATGEQLGAWGAGVQASAQHGRRRGLWAAASRPLQEDSGGGDRANADRFWVHHQPRHRQSHHVPTSHYRHHWRLPWIWVQSALHLLNNFFVTCTFLWRES